MRKITIVGVDKDSKVVECEIAGSGERLELPLDATLRSAARGEFGSDTDADTDADVLSESDDSSPGDDDAGSAESEPAADAEKDSATPAADSASTSTPSLTSVATPWDDAVPSDSDSTSAPAKSADKEPANASAASATSSTPRTPLRPKEIQNRVRAGATVDELCELTGMSYTRVEAFAYPILQERGDRAERARRAHPMLADGPAVDSIEKLTADSVEERGIDAELLKWDSWRLKNGNWVVQATWPAGLSDDASAAWEFVPDSHGGVGHPLDDEALAIGDPSLRRQMSAVQYDDGSTGGWHGDTGYSVPAEQAAYQRWGHQPGTQPSSPQPVRPGEAQGTQPGTHYGAPFASQPAQPAQTQPTRQQPPAQPFAGPRATGQGGADIPAVPPAFPAAGDRSPFAVDARQRQETRGYAPRSGGQDQQGQGSQQVSSPRRPGQGSVPTDPTRRPLGGPIELDPEAGRARGPRTHTPAVGDAAWQQGADRGASAPHFGEAAPKAGSDAGTGRESAARSSDSARPAGPQSTAGGRADDDEFLMHPPSDAPQNKAKGKHPTMPSWEDVLLGVRSPKDNS